MQQCSDEQYDNNIENIEKEPPASDIPGTTITEDVANERKQPIIVAICTRPV